jgi:predicted RNA-binding protein associated with RNAse of E/G family
MTEVVVIKCNLEGEETWRYSGRKLKEGRDWVLIEARFNRPDLPFHGIVFRENDRFVELYFSGRWYNLFEVHDKEDDRVKGWYCNITRPAVFMDGRICYVDLALDLLVYPDGQMQVLDEDEFALLALEEDTRVQAQQALQELEQLFKETKILTAGLASLTA